VSNEFAIEVKNLDKIYKADGKAPAKHALKSINLNIRRGSIFGLLGPNGAGKSTFINILAGLVNKSSGTANVWGFDLDENPRNVSANIGVVTQELVLDAFFTPREVLDLQAGLYGIPKDKRITDEILKLIQLEDKADAYARTLSGGMKRRLMVGKAMVHTPPILILDEPTAGVDVELRQQLWTNVRTLNNQGVTIVLTTHYLEEAEELCDEIAIINHGKVVACEKTSDLLARVEEKKILIRSNNAPSTIPVSLQKLNIDQVDANTYSVQVNRSTTSMQSIIDAFGEANITIDDISTKETDLEEIFLQITRQS
jgi:ABC-2 type transport system ATP-binding protein